MFLDIFVSEVNFEFFVISNEILYYEQQIIFYYKLMLLKCFYDIEQLSYKQYEVFFSVFNEKNVVSKIVVLIYKYIEG